MLRSIALENFKAYERLDELELRPLTVFCGPNGVGKSTVIQALLMMQQTIRQQPEGESAVLVTDGEAVSLGDFVDVLFGRDLGRPLGIELNSPASWGERGFWKEPVTLTLRLEYAASSLGKSDEFGDWERFRSSFAKPELTQLRLTAKEDNGQELVTVNITQDACAGKCNDEPWQYWGEHIVLTFGESMKCSDRNFGSWELASDMLPEGCESGPGVEPTERWFEKITPGGLTLTEWDDDCGAEELIGLVTRMLYEVSSQLRVRYVGPAREAPQRYYDADRSSLRTGARRRGERDWKTDFLDAGTATNPPWPPGSPRLLRGSMDHVISAWLSYLGLPQVHPYLVGRDLRLVVSSPYAEECSVSIADTGYGVSQVLPVILAGLFAEKGEILVLDQPELHLHPRVQAGIADFAVAFAKRRRKAEVEAFGERGEDHLKGYQVLVETHSDHFVNRIVRRVVEGEIDSNDVAVYFIEQTIDGPRVAMVEVDPTFGIKNWPLGFFDDFANDQAEIIRASIKRRKQGDE